MERERYGVLLKEGVWGKVKNKRILIIIFMWKKILRGGVVLGAISACMLVVSHLIFTYDLKTYGLDLKTGDMIGTVGAFGVSIAIGVIAIAAFARLCLSEK